MSEQSIEYITSSPVTRLRPKIYMSGPISDIPLETACKEFEKAENILLRMGFDVVNPMKLPHDHDKSWQSYMRDCIAALLPCDAIFLLKDWYESRGAVLEEHIATELSIKKFSWASKTSSLHAYVKEFSQKMCIAP